jgi:hypothetical protein
MDPCTCAGAASTPHTAAALLSARPRAGSRSEAKALAAGSIAIPSMTGVPCSPGQLALHTCCRFDNRASGREDEPDPHGLLRPLPP